MLLRSFSVSDIPRIDEIWRAHHSNDFSVPNRRNALIDAVVENEKGEVVAYGQVKIFAEAMFILDKSASRREKIEALQLLMLEAFRGAKLGGIEQMYAFIKDPAFMRLIEKHFHFQVVDYPGDLLMREM